jgi:organic hydroperoxide reductase OsmC/OhrA
MAALLSPPQKTGEIALPVAITVFREDVFRAPETWVRRAYRNLVYYHEVDKGGHFAAWEQPELFSAELRATFKSLRFSNCDKHQGERIMTQSELQRSEAHGKVIYTATTHTGKKGVSRSSDGRLDVMMSPLGSSRRRTNPEQLFATAWSACFEGIALVSHRKNVKLPADVASDGEVGFRLEPSAPASTSQFQAWSGHRPRPEGMLQSVAVCRCFKATSVNIAVAYNVL